jgi:hypothetical protein
MKSDDVREVIEALLPADLIMAWCDELKVIEPSVNCTTYFFGLPVAIKHVSCCLLVLQPPPGSYFINFPDSLLDHA